MKTNLIAVVLFLSLLLTSCSQNSSLDPTAHDTDPILAETSAPLPPPKYEDIPYQKRLEYSNRIEKIKEKEKRLYESSQMPHYTLYEGEGWNDILVCRVGDVLELKAMGEYRECEVTYEAFMESFFRLNWKRFEVLSVSGLPGHMPDEDTGEKHPCSVLTLKVKETDESLPCLEVVTYIIRDHVNKAEKILYYPIVIVE